MKPLHFVVWILLAFQREASSKAFRRIENESAQVRSRRFTPTLGAITGVISAGTSMVSTAQQYSQLLSSIKVKIEVANYCNMPLEGAKAYTNHGHVVVPPSPTIQPGKEESMLVAKNTGVRGSFGTLSYKLAGMQIIIMWSNPYSYIAHKNWLAVGIRSYYDPYNDADKMYYDSDERAWFKREPYYDTANSVKYCSGNGKVCVNGIMGQAHKTTVKVYVKCVGKK